MRFTVHLIRNDELLELEFFWPGLMSRQYAQFADLPLELLPVIVQYVVKPSHLAAICLVDHRFYEFTIPLLYERVFIYAWHKEGKAKVSGSFYNHEECPELLTRIQVIRLFRTLAEYPHLAKYVLQLGQYLLWNQRTYWGAFVPPTDTNTIPSDT